MKIEITGKELSKAINLTTRFSIAKAIGDEAIRELEVARIHATAQPDGGITLDIEDDRIVAGFQKLGAVVGELRRQQSKLEIYGTKLAEAICSLRHTRSVSLERLMRRWQQPKVYMVDLVDTNDGGEYSVAISYTEIIAETKEITGNEHVLYSRNRPENGTKEFLRNANTFSVLREKYLNKEDAKRRYWEIQSALQSFHLASQGVSPEARDEFMKNSVFAMFGDE